MSMKDIRENTRRGSCSCKVIFILYQFYSDKTPKDLVIFQLSYFMTENLLCTITKKQSYEVKKKVDRVISNKLEGG